MWFVWTLLLVTLVATLALAGRGGRRRGRPFLRGSGRLYQRHYSRRNFFRLGAAITGAAALAYSGVDEAVDRWHSNEVRSERTDALAEFLHFFGERPWFLFWGLLALGDSFWHSNLVTRWGRTSFEAMLVGLPSLWVVQRGLGASRPSEANHGPRFLPLVDDNSASGHTFIAAIPCLVAARMARRVPPKTLAYAISPLSGWARINDRKHYLSQVALGYGLAWSAVETVSVSRSVKPTSAPAPDRDHFPGQ